MDKPFLFHGRTTKGRKAYEVAMVKVSIIDNRLQRVADFGNSQFWAMDRATMPPSNKNRSEVKGARSKKKETPLQALYLKCHAIWDFSHFILFPFMGDFNSINNGIPFNKMNISGKPLATLFSIFWKKEFLGSAFFISLPSVFSVDIVYGKK
jgi:hypothetical protein